MRERYGFIAGALSAISAFYLSDGHPAAALFGLCMVAITLAEGIADAVRRRS